METDVLLPAAKRRRGPGKGGEASRRCWVYEAEAGEEPCLAAMSTSRQLVHANQAAEYYDAPGADSSTCSADGAEKQLEAYQIAAGAAGGSRAWNKLKDRSQQAAGCGGEDKELDHEAADAEEGPSLGEGTEAGSTEPVHQDDADSQVVESYILDVDHNGNLIGDRALQQAFQVETAAIHRRAVSGRAVPVSCNVDGKEFKHRLRLALEPGGSLCLSATKYLKRTMSLTPGDKLRLSICENGRIFIELAAPAATGREWSIQLTQSSLCVYVVLPISALEMLLGFQAARQLDQVIPLRLDPRVATHQGPEPPGVTLSNTKKSRWRHQWRLQGLTSWFLRQGAMAGDCLILRSVRIASHAAAAAALPAVVPADKLHGSGFHHQQATNGPDGANVVYYRLRSKGIDLGDKTLQQPTQLLQASQVRQPVLDPQLLQVLQVLSGPQLPQSRQMPQQPHQQVQAQGGQHPPPHAPLLLLLLQKLHAFQQQSNAAELKAGAFPPGSEQLCANAVRQLVLGEAAAVGRLLASPVGNALLSSLAAYSHATSTAAAPPPAGPAITRQAAIPPPHARADQTASLADDGISVGKAAASGPAAPASGSAMAGGHTVGLGAVQVVGALGDGNLVHPDSDSATKLTHVHQQSAAAAAVAIATTGQAAGAARGGPPAPVNAQRAQPDAASLPHLHGCLPPIVSLPILQPGEVRVCGVTFAADLNVQQLQTAWQARQLCTLAPQQQICVPFSMTEGCTGSSLNAPSPVEAHATGSCGSGNAGLGDNCAATGPGCASTSAHYSLADAPWVAAFRGPNALTVLPICYDLSMKLGLTQDCAAPLPVERLQLVQVEVLRDPMRPGEAGLFAKETIPRNRVICIMEGFVKAQLPDGNDVFMERGHQLLPETLQQQLQRRVAACGGEADVELFWRFLVMAFRMAFPGHEEGRAAYPGFPALELQMLGHGGVSAYVNDPRISGWEEGERRGVNQWNASLDVNCVVVPVLVRGVPLPVLVALRDITTGEQLLRDYGAQWWHSMEEWLATLRIFYASPADVLHDPGAVDALPPPRDHHHHRVQLHGTVQCRGEDSSSDREHERQQQTIQGDSAVAAAVTVVKEEVREHGRRSGCHSSHDMDRCRCSRLHNDHKGRNGNRGGSDNSSCNSEGH